VCECVCVCELACVCVCVCMYVNVCTVCVPYLSIFILHPKFQNNALNPTPPLALSQINTSAFPA
jgi:hypothetical protein